MLNRNNFSAFQSSKGRLFVVTLFFVMVASLLFWLDSFRAYEADIEVLVIGKSASVDSNQVVDTLAALTQNLSFYDRLLAENDSIEDASLGMTPDKRKEFWNEMVTATRDGQSGIVVIRARGAEPETARVMAKQTAQTLMSLVGFYYNVKTDIDLRIVDGPVTKTIIGHPVLYVATSLGSAVAATAVFFFVLWILPTVFGKKRQSQMPSHRLQEETFEKKQTLYDIGESVPYIDPRKFIPSKPATLSFETPYPEMKEVAASTQAMAPANLPVAHDSLDLPVFEDDLPFQFEETLPEDVPVEFPTRGEHEINKENIPLESVVGPGMDTSFDSSYDESERALSEEGISEENVRKEDRQTEEVPAEIHQSEPTIDEYKRRLNELLAGGK